MGEMAKAQLLWDRLSEQFAAEHDGVAHGKMMSAPALTYGGKVFAFYSSKGGRIGLGCRLGRDYPFENLRLTDWQHLAPFKTRPPMKDWIVAGLGDSESWELLMAEALTIATQRET